MKLSPEGKLYLLGVALCVALTICSQNFADRGGPPFMASLGVAALVYLFSIREFFTTSQFPRCAVVVGLVLAAAFSEALASSSSAARCA